MDLGDLEERIASVHRGRTWIVTADAAAAATPVVERLRGHGAAGVMVIAGSEGTGDPPEADSIAYTRTTGTTIMEGIRAFVDAVERPSPTLLAAVDAFDPDGHAMVLGAGFSRMDRLAGRPVYGSRPAAWGALEDKTIAPDLWADADVPTAPADVLPLEAAPAAAERLAGPQGTVWVADNRCGWHGGGEFTRWVPSPDHVPEVVEWFRPHADTVRVMPFLEGIPCSIHGFVTDAGTAVFLPVEIYTLRRRTPPGFSYARVGNFWEPPDDVTSEMRSAARRVASVLAARVGYRGGFGIDGVWTGEGFRPTELNPRLTVGLGLQSRTAEVPIGDIERLMLEGALTVDPGDLESTITSAVERERRGAFMFTTSSNLGSTEVGYRFGDDGTASATDVDDDDAHGTMRSGPAPFGSVIMVSLDPDVIRRGPSTAHLAPVLMDLARDVWNADLPVADAATAPAG